jgi:hypothetical protein
MSGWMSTRDEALIAHVSLMGWAHIGLTGGYL